MSRFKKILWWAAHLLLLGLCLEIAARIDDRLTYGAPLWSRYDSDMLRETDADGIPRDTPGARFEKWKVNSLGFRGEEVAQNKPPGVWRIVCMGQSETFGLFESEGGEWPARLARLLRSTHPDVEVINASVAGMGRNSRQAYLEKYVFPLQPDVVILYMMVVADGITEEKPLASDSASPGAEIFPQSRLLPKLKPRLLAMIPEKAANAAQTWRLDRGIRKREQEKLHGRPPRDALPLENVANFERYAHRLVQFLRKKGVTPILATYPTLVNETNAERYHIEFARARIYHVEFSEQGWFDAARKLNGVVRQVASELAVALVDADSSMPKTAEFFRDYVHYSDEGAEFVAERVLEVIAEAGLLGASAARAAADDAPLRIQ
jgi:lysophospholipase L1-like esterase